MVTSGDVTIVQDGGQSNIKLHPYLVALVRWCVSCVWSTATVLLHRLVAGSLPAPTIRVARFTVPKPPQRARAAGTDHLHPDPKVECQVLHTPAAHSCDVIFVHGLYGSLANTWRQGDWRSKYKLEPNKVPLLRPADCKCETELNEGKCKINEYEVNINEVTYDVEEKLYNGIQKILPNEEAFIAEKFYNNTLLDQVEIVDNYETQAKFVRDLFENENRSCDKNCDSNFKNVTNLNFECEVNEVGRKLNEVNCKCEAENGGKVDETSLEVNEIDCECKLNEGRKCQVGCGCVCDVCYSSCWPRDWIKEDYPEARVISINYTSDPYLWRPLWVKECKRLRLHERAEQMTKQLLELGVGDKPIIWVGHSKGGLFIKQIYCEAYEAYLKTQSNTKNEENIDTSKFVIKDPNDIANNNSTNDISVQEYSIIEENNLILNENYFSNENEVSLNVNVEINGNVQRVDSDRNVDFEIERTEKDDSQISCTELSSNREDYSHGQSRLWRNSAGFMFYSVPHRGSPLADIKTPITARSIELLEISKDCALVLSLQERWLAATATLSPQVRSLVETNRTLMSVLWLRIVSVPSAGPPGVSFEDGYLQILPVDKAKCPFVRDHNDITFRLYTRHNPIMFQELKIDDDESLFASHMDFHDPTVIYFSAFLEQPDDGSGLQVRESYMLRGDTNFIILDLSRLEAGPWYFTAAENTWYIGNFAAKLIDYLVSRGLDLKKTHLVGHSLGAQSAGVAGSVLKSGRVSRITGLDPAFPLFDKLPLSQRLDPSDADFVDVIHTDAGIFGFNRPTGHVDFYPNGGISPQPGCELEVVLHEQRLLNKFFCSHWRSYQFYSESVIRPKAFVATSCDSWRHYKGGFCARAENTHMGFGADPNKSAFCTIPGEIDAQPHGYYKFTLDTNNKKLKFEDRLKQYFLHIRELKNIKQQIGTPTKKAAVENKPTTTENKQKLNKLYKNNDKNKYINDNTNKNDDVTTSEENEQTYKRSKRTDNTVTTETDKVTNYNMTTNDNIKTDTQEPKNNGTIDINPDKQGTKTNSNITDQTNNTTDIKTKTTTKRSKRFISFFKNDNDDNFLFKMLEFLTKNRRHIIPVVTVMREINTLVKNANGELSHVSKERNNYIGAPPSIIPIAVDLDIGGESKVTAFVKRLLGLGSKGGRLSINGSGK